MLVYRWNTNWWCSTRLIYQTEPFRCSCKLDLQQGSVSLDQAFNHLVQVTFCLQIINIYKIIHNGQVWCLWTKYKNVDNCFCDILSVTFWMTISFGLLPISSLSKLSWLSCSILPALSTDIYMSMSTIVFLYHLCASHGWPAVHFKTILSSVLACVLCLLQFLLTDYLQLIWGMVINSVYEQVIPTVSVLKHNIYKAQGLFLIKMLAKAVYRQTLDGDTSAHIGDGQSLFWMCKKLNKWVKD